MGKVNTGVGVLGLLLLSCQCVLGQVDHRRSSGWIWGPSVGYQYQGGSFLKASGWGLFAANESQYVRIDAGANFSWAMDKTTVIPELGLTYYLSNRLVWPFLKAEATPYTITPKVGISVLSLIDVGVGYGFSIQEKKDFRAIKGFTVSVGLNIPLNFHIQ